MKQGGLGSYMFLPPFPMWASGWASGAPRIFHRGVSARGTTAVSNEALSTGSNSWGRRRGLGWVGRNAGCGGGGRVFRKILPADSIYYIYIYIHGTNGTTLTPSTQEKLDSL